MKIEFHVNVLFVYILQYMWMVGFVHFSKSIHLHMQKILVLLVKILKNLLSKIFQHGMLY